MKGVKMKKKDTALITNELLFALLNQLYSIELILADVYNGKANLRYSNMILERDKEVIDALSEIISEDIKEEHEDQSGTDK